MASSSEDEQSENENWDDFGQFQFLQLPRDEQERLENRMRGILTDDDSDNESFDGFNIDDVYQPPAQFVRTRDFQVNAVLNFRRRVGPVRVYDLSATTPLSYFQLFYTEEIFQHITDCTNNNARYKIEKFS